VGNGDVAHVLAGIHHVYRTVPVPA
jgi:hypothetical protein